MPAVDADKQRDQTHVQRQDGPCRCTNMVHDYDWPHAATTCACRPCNTCCGCTANYRMHAATAAAAATYCPAGLIVFSAQHPAQLEPLNNTSGGLGPQAEYSGIAFETPPGLARKFHPHLLCQLTYYCPRRATCNQQPVRLCCY